MSNHTRALRSANEALNPPEPRAHLAAVGLLCLVVAAAGLLAWLGT